MAILEAIKHDHDEMRGLLSKLLATADGTDEQKKEIIQQIRDEMVPHARAEEKVVYNSMRMADAPTDKVYHGFKEHAEAEMLLMTLEAMDALNVEWKAVAEKFAHELRHHMEEEEEDLFPQVRAAFAPPEFEAMEQEFERLKPEIREQSRLKNTMSLVGNLVPPKLADMLTSDDTKNSKN